MKKLNSDAQTLGMDRTVLVESIELALQRISFDSPHRSITKSDLDEAMASLKHSLSVIDRLSKEVEMLRNLAFDSMEERHSRFAEAHSKTFEWVFNTEWLPLHDPRSKISLEAWLTSGTGLFWVSGKPGSGKSTFMKWLAQEPTTIKSLQQWAMEADVVTASFYFWISGTSIQKSQQGLLRSLLFEILSKCPGLIPTILPERWNHQKYTPFTTTELNDALARLTSSVPDKKFCFFIDGLDEYDGDHFEIIDTMTNLVESTHIKLCLSSRPWNCFEDAFGSQTCRKLYLHDLTRQDIESYARAKLPKARYSIALTREGVAHDSLILDIVDRAQGVFLWVFLVVRSLRHGMVNGDNVAMLQKRLYSLPADLEPYFKHILTSVDALYSEKVGSMFLAAIEAGEPLRLITHSFMDEDDPDYAIKLTSIKPLLPKDIIAHHVVMRRRVNGRSRGLLEVDNSQSSMPKVSFLHRTVRDFLQLKDIDTMLKGMATESFNANSTLARAFLAEMKTEFPFAEEMGITKRPPDIAILLKKAENQSGRADMALVDELEAFSNSRYHMFLESPFSFLEFAVEHDLTCYVGSKLARHPELGSPSLLSTALTMILRDWKTTNGTMVHTLLSQGVSPNFRSRCRNIKMNCWEQWVADFQLLLTDRTQVWMVIARQLLAYGADAHLGSSVLLKIGYAQIKSSRPALISKAGEHCLDAIALLLSHGMDPNESAGKGDSVWARFLKQIVDSPYSYCESLSGFF